MTPYQLHVLRWKDCAKCDLASQRSRIVLCRGSLPCDVLFVGEAPGMSEDSRGQPFVGPAGQELDRWIEMAGLQPGPLTFPTKLAFTNLVACYPREAKRAGTNEPQECEIKACRDRLKELIGLCGPSLELVVAVGKLAHRYLIKWQDKLGLASDVKILEIVHPSFVLKAKHKNPAQAAHAKQRAIISLATAAEELVPF